jgi:penicillin amidase
MALDDAAVLAALTGERSAADVCKAAGVGAEEFAKARAAWLRRHAAIPDQTLKAGVGAKVEILRDRAGIPHVFAKSTPDLYLGVGFAMAQDRLWQMDRLRRRALGRQAEILGAGFVAADTAHLTVGIDRMAAEEPSRMDGKTYEETAAFVRGINRAIERFGADLPIEFRMLGYTPAPFTVSDAVAIARGFWWSLNGRLDRIMAAESARLLPEGLRDIYLTPEASEHLVVPPPGWPDISASPPMGAGTDDATGSNNWAVAGSRAAGGKALLAGDPHQPFWVPSSWYEYGLHGPEDDAAGAGPVGMPGLWWGSNGTVAFAITNNMAMTRDLYREEVDPADTARYRDGDSWRRFDERVVSIPVKGEATRALVVRSTVRGPVVNAIIPQIAEGGDPVTSMRWVGAEHIDDIRASINVGRARNWEQFRTALRDWAVAVFNWVYADAEGNAGYQMAGRLPIRGRMHYGVRDANNPADRWLGYIPFDGLPHRYNPSTGFVASANQRIVEPDYKYPIYGAYSQGHRGIRIDQAFAGTKADREHTIRLQNDVKSVRAERSAGHVVALLKGSGDAEAEALAAMLDGWDYLYTVDSTAATVFETFMFHWQRATLAVHFPPRLLDLTMQQTNLCVHLLANPGMAHFPGGTKAAAVAAAKASLATLRARLGDDPKGWTWGTVHVAHWKHPITSADLAADFDIGPAPLDGGSHTVRNTGGELPPHAASSGAEYRIVMDFADPRRFLAVQNIGNSGMPGSPHYRDQFDPFIKGEYHVVSLDRADIARDLESTTTLEP